MQITFETRDCGRCGGTGLFGPACIYHGICFACGGRKQVDTPAGARAYAKFMAWARAHCAVPFDALVGGPRVKIPPQVAAITPEGGVVTLRLRKPHRVRRVVRQVSYQTVNGVPTEHVAYDVTFHVILARSPGPFIRYDVAAEELTITVPETEPLLRAATRVEMLTVYPTLGVGATLRDDDGTVLQQNVPTAAQVARAEKAAERKAAKVQQVHLTRAEWRATVEAALAADARLWTDEPHPAGFVGKTYRDYVTWCLANAPTMVGRFAAKLATQEA